MGLEKLVVKQVVKVAKDTGRLENTIDTMKNKLIDEGISVIEKTGINPADLPFSPQALMNGEVSNPSQLLTPEVVCSQQPLTNKQKADATRAVDSTLLAVNQIITSKNQIAGALNVIKTPLNTITTTGQTLGSIISTVKAAVKVIKAIPLPTAIIPPSGGIGIPINVLTILSDSLDQLDKLLTYGKGVTKVIPELTGGVVKMINTTVSGLNKLDDTILPVVTTMSFVKTIVEKGDSCPNLSQGDINEVQTALSQDINESVEASGDSSDPSTNDATNQGLIDAMQPNSEPPLVYRGFTLTLEENPKNEFSFPQRRIKGFRNFLETNAGEEVFAVGDKFSTQITQKTLYNSPKGLNADDFSYSSSVSVLFDEMKYKIDGFLLSLRFGLVAANDFDRNVGAGNFSDDQEAAADALGLDIIVNGYQQMNPSSNFSQQAYENTPVTGQILAYTLSKVGFKLDAGSWKSNQLRGKLTITKGGKPVETKTLYSTGAKPEIDKTGIIETEFDLVETGQYDYKMEILFNYINPQRSNVFEQSLSFTVTEI